MIVACDEAEGADSRESEAEHTEDDCGAATGFS